MQQHNLKIVNNCLNGNIHSYLEKSGGQSSNLYLNAVHFYDTSVNFRHLWQLKTVVFLPWCLIYLVLVHFASFICCSIVSLDIETENSFLSYVVTDS
jgi:hypothetical protein